MDILRRLLFPILASYRVVFDYTSEFFKFHVWYVGLFALTRLEARLGFLERTLRGDRSQGEP